MIVEIKVNDSSKAVFLDLQGTLDVIDKEIVT